MTKDNFKPQDYRVLGRPIIFENARTFLLFFILYKENMLTQIEPQFKI